MCIGTQPDQGVMSVLLYSHKIMWKIQYIGMNVFIVHVVNTLFLKGFRPLVSCLSCVLCWPNLGVFIRFTPTNYSVSGTDGEHWGSPGSPDYPITLLRGRSRVWEHISWNSRLIVIHFLPKPQSRLSL